MGYIIASVNNKGGTGKTALVTNLAHPLGTRGMKVLVVDIDSQCNTTHRFVGRKHNGPTLFDLYTKDISPADCIVPTEYENIYCLPNSPKTAGYEKDLYENLSKSYFLLRDRIREYANENFDFTLLDCPPNLGMFVVQALNTADFAIVPIEAGSIASLDGLEATLEMVGWVKGEINPNLRFLRLLINKTDKRTAISKIMIEYTKERFGAEEIFETHIPLNTTIQQAELHGQTVNRYDSSSTGAIHFRKLAKELMALLDLEPRK